jgi:hypothetical protein
MEIEEKAVRGRGIRVAKRESEEDRRCEKTEGVVEIEELKAPFGIDLLGVCPASPAKHAEHHQE